MRSMTSDPKSFTFTPAVDEFEAIELREPVDLADVSRLVGDAKDPIAGARLYSVALRETAISLLAYREHGRDALELSAQVVSPLFDELTGAFADSYRERGHLLLWALLKATSIIGAPAVPIAPEIESAVPDKAKRIKALNDEQQGAMLEAAVRYAMKLEKATPTKGEGYAKKIRPNVIAELRRIGFPGQAKGKWRDWPSISTISGAVTKIIGGLSTVSAPEGDR
jgi:hypothetical protein